MTPIGYAALGQLAQSVLARRAGPAAGAEAIAAAADRAYAELARAVAPIIGDAGMTALADRAVHLAATEYTWLRPARKPEPAQQVFAPMQGFAHIGSALKAQGAAVATDAAAAAIFARLLELLATFIGEPLAMRLVGQAWPDALPSAHAEET